MILNRLPFLVLALLSLPVGGCGGPVDVDLFDATLTTPVEPGDGYSLVRLRPTDNGFDITMMAVSANYLSFGIQWTGIYRLPKLGGKVELIQNDRTSESPQTLSMGANRDDLFWVRSVRGQNELLQRKAVGGPARVIASHLRDVPQFGSVIAEESRVYVSNTDGVTMVPLDGGVPVDLIVPGLDRDSWLLENPVADFPSVYMAECTFIGETDQCPLFRGDVNSGAVERVAVLPGQAVVAAVDEGFLYIRDQRRVWKLAKSDFSRTDLFGTGPIGSDGDGEGVYGTVLVDAENVYFNTSGPPGYQIRAIRKDGTSAARVVGRGSQIEGSVRLMEQDDQFIFVLAGPRVRDDGPGGSLRFLDSGAILAFPKNPTFN